MESETSPLLPHQKLYEQPRLNEGRYNEESKNTADVGSPKKGTKYPPDEVSKEEMATPSFWRDTNCRQKTLLAYVAVVNFLDFFCVGSVSPFLARVVLEKGGTVLESSIMIQVTMLINGVFSLIFGKYQALFGCKTLIIVGQATFALFHVAFGTIGYFEDATVLVVVGTLLRAIQGIGQSALSVAALTIVCQEFPHHISVVYGIFEASYGAGYLAGPYVGGLLYDLSGGMLVPLAATGALTFMFSIVGFVLLNRYDRWEDSEVNYYFAKILFNPKAILIIGGASSVLGGFALCDATITIYLKPMGFSATDVGLLLFLMGCGYTIAAAGIGLLQRLGKTVIRLFMIFSYVCCLGLPFVFTSDQSKPWIHVAVSVFAVCTAIVFIPSFNELLNVISTNERSLSTNISLLSAMSGVWSSAINLGNFLITLIGSAFENFLPFYLSFLLSMLCGIGFSAAMALIMFVIAMCRNRASS